jgi:DNA-binding CsgD family transcriptional regulator
MALSAATVGRTGLSGDEGGRCPDCGRRLWAPHLSRREREVLTLMADGLSTAETAAVLGLTAKTIENYRRTLREALGVHSSVQAVVRGIEVGLVRLRHVACEDGERKRRR